MTGGVALEMRVLLNTQCLQGPLTGIGVYTRELACALQTLDADIAFTTSIDRFSAHKPPRRVVSWIRDHVPFAYTLRRSLGQREFHKHIRRHRPTVYHEPTLWPYQFDGPQVVTVHDITYITHPDTQPKRRLKEMHRRCEPALQKATAVIVDSAFMADELRTHLSIERSKIHVVPLAAGSHFRPHTPEETRGTLARYGLMPGQYLVCAGTLEPRKNLPLALEAWSMLPPKLRDTYPLVLVGMNGWKTETLETHLTGMSHRHGIRAVGHVPDATMAHLVAGAALSLFPTQYEGFGLPILEAMASGTPIVLNRVSALPEVAGEAGIYPEDGHAATWRDTVAHYLESPAQRALKSAQGMAHAQMFSWKRCAQQTWAVYEEVAAH